MKYIVKNEIKNVLTKTRTSLGTYRKIEAKYS
jgi:hypothetical protein